MKLYEANLFNGENDWVATQGQSNISNGEITVSAVSILKYISVDLLRFKRYIIDFELFNVGDNRITFGIMDENNKFYVRQGIATTNISISDKCIKELDYNIYNTTNQWKNIKIIRNISMSTIFIESSRYDLNYPIKGRYFYLYKWYSLYIKVRNIRITILSSVTCRANKPNFKYALNIFLMISFS